MIPLKHINNSKFNRLIRRIFLAAQVKQSKPLCAVRGGIPILLLPAGCCFSLGVSDNDEKARFLQAMAYRHV